MANYSIRISINKGTSRRPPRQRAYSVWECPYCHGKGTVLGIVREERCPACRGNMYWEADARAEDLLPCNRCQETGRILGIVNPEVCPMCHGSGKV